MNSSTGFDTDRERETKFTGLFNDNRRFLALLLYGFATFMQTLVWNTWSPISGSVLFAFPKWTTKQIALLNNWGCLLYILFAVPCNWFLDSKGMRPAFICATFLSLIGSAFRCFSLNQYSLLWLAHIGAILNSLGGVILCPAPALLSSVWFPRKQRTTATGIGAVLGQLGMAGSALLGPKIVESSLNIVQSLEANRLRIQDQIGFLMLIECCMYLLLFSVLVSFFPDKPLKPVSLSQSRTRLSYRDSLRYLSINKDMWLLSIASALCMGITVPWLSMITVVFTNISQSEADSISFWTIILSSAIGLTVTRCADLVRGQLKTTIQMLMMASTFCFFWMLLLTNGTFKFSKAQLTFTVMVGISFSWATPALFLELASEICYPVQEGIVGGYMSYFSNFSSLLIYIFILSCPNSDTSWMNYALVFYSLLCMICVYFVEANYFRTYVDKTID